MGSIFCAIIDLYDYYKLCHTHTKAFIYVSSIFSASLDKAEVTNWNASISLTLLIVSIIFSSDTGAALISGSPINGRVSCALFIVR